MSDSVEDTDERSHLELLIGADIRALTRESDWFFRDFAVRNGLNSNDLRALLLVVVAETSGKQLTAGELRRAMGLSGAAITYLVERLTETGLLRREADPADRRKVILGYGKRGREVARTLFAQSASQGHRALQGISDADLKVAHRTFSALVDVIATTNQVTKTA